MIKYFFLSFIFGILISIALCSCQNEQTHLVVDDRIQMGTQWIIKVYAEDTILAQKGIQDAWSLLDSLDHLLSNYKSASEVSLLSKSSGSGQWITISKPTLEVLELSQQMWEASNGAFDITIGPVSKIWKRAFKIQEWPSDASIEEAHELVGMEYLELDNSNTRARLQQKGMSIDLGGIAKGYAIDQIARHLEVMDLGTYLVEGGGDIRLGQPPINQLGWYITYQAVHYSGQLISVTDTLANCSIAVSGNSYQHIDWEGKRYQHHINARTSEPQSDLYNVTILADKCWKADALSTAISILGRSTIKDFNYEGAIIRGNGTYELEEISNKL